MVNEEEWKIHMTSDGRIEEDYQLRKVRFQSVISVHVWRKFTKKYFICYFYCKMMSYFLLKCLDNFFLMNEPKDVSFGIWTNISYSPDVLYMYINLFCAFSAYILWWTGPPPATRDVAIPASLLSLGLHIWGEGGHQKRPLHTVPGHQENEVQHRISNSKLFDNSVAKKTQTHPIINTQ